MKYLFTYIVFFSISLTLTAKTSIHPLYGVVSSGLSQADGGIPMVFLKDSAVIEAIRAYRKDLTQYKGRSASILFLRQDGHNEMYGIYRDKKESYYSLGDITRLNDILDHMPYAYTKVDGQVVLLYAPNETVITYPATYLDVLKPELSKIEFTDTSKLERFQKNPNLVLVTDFWDNHAWKITTYTNGTYTVKREQ